MTLYNVYGISNWPESLGEAFLIFSKKAFQSDEEAIQAAKAEYSDDLEVVLEKC